MNRPALCWAANSINTLFSCWLCQDHISFHNFIQDPSNAIPVGDSISSWVLLALCVGIPCLLPTSTTASPLTEFMKQQILVCVFVNHPVNWIPNFDLYPSIYIYIYIHIIIYICINIYIHNYIHYIYNHWKLDCDRPIDQFQAKCCMFWTLAGYDLRTCLHSDGSQLVFLWFLSWCLVNKEI